MIQFSAAQTKIAFEVSFSEPQAHYTDVKMHISGIAADYLDIKMPVWAPGSYLVREFAKNVEQVKAYDKNNRPVSYNKINKNTWRVHTAGQEVWLNYRVYCFEISVRTSFVDNSHAFISPTGIFMYVDGQINQPAIITVSPARNWTKISTGLEAVKGSSNTYYTPDFDILYDSPIEVGNQDIFEFNAAGVKHEVAMYGGGNYDKERLKVDMAKIVEEETRVFGENPNKRYVFIVHNYADGGGGLEHLNSTVLGASRNEYANPSGYINFLRLVAHEYFHLWNVKRLRPEALGPFDYDHENYTTNLWISEGFTAYYDKLFVARSGMQSPGNYLNALVKDINTYENQPGNKYQSVSESSFDAWIKQYRPNENSRNNSISYYTKGALIGMLLDLEIIHASNGKRSLDDVMKAAYNEFYKKKNKGFTDAAFKNLLEIAAGKNLDAFYAAYINGTEAIKYNQYLAYAGYKLVNNADSGTPYLGVSTSVKDGKLMVTGIVRNSGAWANGINVNDELIAIDGERVNTDKDLDKMISAKKVDDTISILISRDNRVQTIVAELKENPTVQYRIVPMEQITSQQAAVRKKWIGE
ncbi:M61 family metallopeptidase [Pedobacter sp. BS3]|uniref:M61 family metallopeptidase n=1 Tax=Pedobacter sp. BS3 TaxID=2567937 RepID=UPI0011EC379A|nr:PDZ domain-containing protein [Pedobacter sp. BS3]TZF84044.1 M61 family metallopeptidase [Pedobacter sp. BS3]